MSRFDEATFRSVDGEPALSVKRDKRTGRMLMRIGDDGPIFTAVQSTVSVLAGFMRNGDAPFTARRLERIQAGSTGIQDQTDGGAT